MEDGDKHVGYKSINTKKRFIVYFRDSLGGYKSSQLSNKSFSIESTKILCISAVEKAIY